MPTAIDIYRPDMNDTNTSGTTGPISAARLEKAAFDYLGRYMASTETLRRVLERRVLKAGRSGPVDQDDAEAVIAGVVAKCRRLGLVDDQRFAEVRAASLARRGDSPRAILAKLAQKGIDGETAQSALSKLRAESETDLALTSAVRLAERRRLGPYRLRDREQHRDRDLAALARAGYGLAIARAIVDAEQAEDLQAMVAQSADGG